MTHPLRIKGSSSVAGSAGSSVKASRTDHRADPSETSSHVRVLMPVYNTIETDGRVQRAAAALAEWSDVIVLSVGSGTVGGGHEYFTVPVARPWWVPRRMSVLHFWARVFREAVKRRPHLIYAHDYYLPWVGALASKWTGATFVYDAHELVVPEDDRPTKFRSWLWATLERRSIGAADLIVAASDERAQIMVDYYGLVAKPIVVRNISEPTAPTLDEGETKELYPKLVREGVTRTVLYQGAMAGTRGLEHFIGAMAFLPPSIRLVVVGDGQARGGLEALTQRLGLEHRVDFLGRVPRNHLPDIMRFADIGVVTYPYTGRNNRLCAPNKIYEYAAGGLPMVGTSQGALVEALDGFGTGRTVDLEGVDVESGARRAASAIEDVLANLASYRSALPGFLSQHRWETEAAGLNQAVMKSLRVAFGGGPGE